MPSWARELHAVVPYSAHVTITAAEKLYAQLTLESDDVALTPCQFMTTPKGGGIGADIGSFAPVPEKFIVNIPLKGGEEIAVYGTALVSNTVAPYMGCSLVVSDKKHGRQRFGKTGTATSTGTTAGEVSGTAYSIHGSERIIEVMGSVGATTLDASKPIVGYVRLTSNDFKEAVPLKYCVTPQSTQLGDLVNGAIGGLARFPVDVPTNTTCTLQDYFNLEIATTSAGYWQSAVVFNKVGR